MQKGSNRLLSVSAVTAAANQYRSQLDAGLMLGQRLVFAVIVRPVLDCPAPQSQKRATAVSSNCLLPLQTSVGSAFHLKSKCNFPLFK